MIKDEIAGMLDRYFREAREDRARDNLAAKEDQARAYAEQARVIAAAREDQARVNAEQARVSAAFSEKMSRAYAVAKEDQARAYAVAKEDQARANTKHNAAADLRVKHIEDKVRCTVSLAL
jgi:hypothetical protein